MVEHHADIRPSDGPLFRLEGPLDLKVGIVASQWHRTVVDGLLGGTLRALREVGIDDPPVVRVPGTFEIPAVAAAFVNSGYDAVVALGVVIQGETPHFGYVCDAVTMGLTRISVQTGVPIGFGVLPCTTREQAYQRSGLSGAEWDKGYDAAQAALVGALAIRRIRSGNIADDSFLVGAATSNLAEL
jgi:6,7-dimethyl-8-ribityllumazine synthase